MMIWHLLPNARAWRVTVDKQLRQFLVGLSGIEVDVREFADLVWLDIFPETTRELDAWEAQFALPSAGLSEAQRRERLAAAWTVLGGQSPGYIQDTLRASGFDVYVHESWEPGTGPAAGVHGSPTYRSPLLWLHGGLRSGVDCGEPLAECGEPTAECGEGTDPPGYALVNKIEGVTYTIPADSTKWPFFIYIGAETFGNLATVSQSRRDEFEALCLKICPTQNWLGLLVTYN